MNDGISAARLFSCFRRVSLCLLLYAAAMLCGCSADRKPGLAGQYWRSAEYTLDEINSKCHPTLYNDERIFKADDVSAEAVDAYNVLLGYAEKILGQEYYVYDYYYADWTAPPHSWLIKVIPYEMAKTAEDEGRGLYIDEPLTLFYKEDGSEVNSTIEPYLMENKWFAELDREMSESFSEYETELEISEFEALYPNVLEEKFPDASDYTYIINEDFYDRSDEWEYGNIINVMLPAGTEQSGAAEVFERIKPTLIRYCVTEVRLFTLTEDEDLDWSESFLVVS